MAKCIIDDLCITNGPKLSFLASNLSNDDQIVTEFSGIVLYNKTIFSDFFMMTSCIINEFCIIDCLKLKGLASSFLNNYHMATKLTRNVF